MKNAFGLACLLVIFAALTRVLPHPSNFTAMGAMALFAGATFSHYKWKFLVPMSALFLTDLYLGLHFSILAVYACFAFTVWLGSRMKSNPGFLRLGIFAVVSSTVFFLFTNLPFWYADLSLYPLTLEGTLLSYTMAIPFYKNQLAADLIYSFSLFGIFNLVTKSSKVAIN
ncbi:MAG: hypothetical protein DWQ44_07330 [Bacteroidetes bacterium]|nr:MAG: hypothetical protein DWQ33_12355 [Bacteroidota bacterium]REJ99826.1 MAG: hypothetical protein DWQ39_12950 [Bacteroidota bacterium]REK34199.1 MAG: hypothetical protein DWQ44_07330 [Bacteroidota bacterium]REK50529.1 MAG: hypothetical protein DWQ48_04240 [Bacteroidota bacterium]